MPNHPTRAFQKALCWFVIVTINTIFVWAQIHSPAKGIVFDKDSISEPLNKSLNTQSSTAILNDYTDPVNGVSSIDLVHQALTSNSEMVAARLEVERARARLRQAGLRPNPTLDLERTNGVLDSPGERNASIGLTFPLEINGQRQRRIDLVRIELEATKADVANRERQLITQVRNAYIETLVALREFEIASEINTLDAQTVHYIEIRVAEGDASPLELNLMRAETDRMHSRKILAEGRLKAALLQLKNLVGTSADESLKLKENLAIPFLLDSPTTVESAVEVALRTRPDLQLARLTEEVAQAGFRLVQAQARPDVTAFTKYSVNQSTFDTTPIGSLTDRDKLLTVGISINLPLFNRNQGSKTEAKVAIAQAKHRREFLEKVIKSEVSAAYSRYEAAQTAVGIFKSGVIERSVENLRAMRGAYEVGAFRITDVISEQRRFTDSQREYTEALAERYRALTALQAAIGITIP